MRVGFVGLGTMGGAMAANAARAGFEVTAWNWTPGRRPSSGTLASRWPDPGGGGRRERHRHHDGLRHPRRRGGPVRPAASPRVQGRAASSRHVDDLAVRDPRLRRPLASKGVAMLDAPVSGGSEGAKKGTLRSSSAARRRTSSGRVRSSRAWDDDHPRRPDRLGPGGQGGHQVILAGTYLGVAEGIVLAIKSGLDVEQVVGRALGRRRAVVGARESERPDARERLPAGVQGRAPPQGSRDRAVDGPGARGVAADQRPVRGDRGRPDRPGPRRRRHVGRGALGPIRALSGLES